MADISYDPVPGDEDDEEDFVDAAYEDDDDEPAPEGPEHEVTIEERAAAMGWKPLPADPLNPQPHEYRGNPRTWSDAPDFIAHGEAQLPILRDQNRRMSERLARVEPEITALKNTVAEQAQAVKDAMALARKADDRGYQRALADLRAQQREAVRGGEEDIFDQVQEQIDALEATRAEVVEDPEPAPRRDPPPPPAPNEPHPDVQAFVDANAAWFNDTTRPRLRQLMIAEHNGVIAEGEIKDVRAQLAEAKARLAERFPEHEDLQDAPMARTPPPRRTPPAPATPRAGAPRASIPGARTSPFDRISDPKEREEVRAQYQRAKRHDESLTASEYVTIYIDPHADVLALRRQRK